MVFGRGFWSIGPGGATPKSASIAPIDLADFLGPEQIKQFHRQRRVKGSSAEDHLAAT